MRSTNRPARVGRFPRRMLPREDSARDSSGRPCYLPAGQTKEKNLSNLFPEAQANLAFPQPLAEKYRPRTIADFIGLEKQRKVIGNFAKRPVSCAWLFVGASGIGKSTMALALADEIKAELHHVPSQKANIENLDATVRKCWFAPMHAGGFHLVLVDEINNCTQAFQLALFSKLDSTDPPPQTIWIFTCNALDRLEKAFLSRCRLLEFSNYGIQSDLAEHLAKVWKAETGADGSLNWARIAKESNGNIRDALSGTTSSIRRKTCKNQRSSITIAAVSNAAQSINGATATRKTLKMGCRCIRGTHDRSAGARQRNAAPSQFSIATDNLKPHRSQGCRKCSGASKHTTAASSNVFPCVFRPAATC